MLTQNDLLPIITDINPNTKTISVCKITQIKNNDIVIAETSDRRAFVPGQIEEVKDYIGVEDSPEIDYLEAIWTQEVIDTYNATQQG